MDKMTICRDRYDTCNPEWECYNKKTYRKCVKEIKDLINQQNATAWDIKVGAVDEYTGEPVYENFPDDEVLGFEQKLDQTKDLT